MSDQALVGSHRSYAGEVLTDAPAGLWMLNESSGSTAVDQSGNARHGSYQAGYTLAQPGPGSVTKSVALTGEASGTGLVDFPNSAASSLTSDFTVGMLVKFDATVTSGVWNLLSLVDATEWSQPLQLSAGKTGAPASNLLTFRVGNGYMSETVVVSPAADLGTSWHHVAFRAAGTTYTVFLDGVSIGSSTSSQARSNSGSVFRLGRRTPSSEQRGRSGKFAGLYICPAALADPRIAAHSAAGLAP